MYEITINNLLIVSISLFSIGVLGVLIRKNAILMFISVEIMLNSAILMLVSFSGYHRSLDGAVLGFIMILIAAVEAVVGLSLIFLLKKLTGTIKLADINLAGES